MTAALAKVLTLVCTLGLKLVAPAASSVLGVVNVEEFRKAVLKACGYSTVPALVVGVLTWIAANDGSFITNAALAGALSTAIGIVLNTHGYLKKGEPLAASSPASAVAPVPLAECSHEACPCNPPSVIAFPAKLPPTA